MDDSKQHTARVSGGSGLEFGEPEGDLLALSVLRYQYPDATSYWDRIWLMAHGRARTGSLEWEFDSPCLTTVELRRLASWLAVWRRDGAGESEITFLEPELAFAMDTRGPRTYDLIARLTFGAAPVGTTPEHSVTLRFGLTDESLGRIEAQATALADEWHRA